MDNLEFINSIIFDKEKEEELNKLLHACIDEICNCVGPKFEQFNLDWNREEFNKVHKFFITLFQNPSCLYLEEEKMPTEYHGLPEHVQHAICTCLRVRQSQLVDALVCNRSSQDLPTLVDFDWRLKYVMGSSKMASIREPLVQLDLIVKDKENEKIIDLELNKEELDLLINTLEAHAIDDSN